LPKDEQYEEIAFEICYFMNGGVQYDYLLNDIDMLEFLKLRKMVAKLSRKQQSEMNKK